MASSMADQVDLQMLPQPNPAQAGGRMLGGSDGTGANPIIVLDSSDGPPPIKGTTRVTPGRVERMPNCKQQRPYTASAPPSPFLLGWLSVNQQSYPYSIPHKYRRKTAPTAPEAPMPDSSEPPRLTGNVSQVPQSPIVSQTPKHKEPNPAVLFIPKSQSSQRPKKKLGDDQKTRTAIASTDNGTKEAPVVAIESDAFLAWGAETFDPVPEPSPATDMLPLAEEQPVVAEVSGPERFKTLKLDANLLEIIVRAVIWDLKLLNSRHNHQKSIDFLENFRRLSAGLHPAHQKLYQARLDDCLANVQGIQNEVDRCLGTLEDDLRTSINDLVVTHHRILQDTPLPPDNWEPKPVQFVEESQPRSAAAGLLGSGIHSSRLQAIQEDSWQDASGGWGGGDNAQPARMGNAGAPDTADLWGCPDPVSGNPGSRDGFNVDQGQTQDRGWGGRSDRGERGGTYENGRRGRGFGGGGRGFGGEGRGFGGEGRGFGGEGRGFGDEEGGFSGRGRGFRGEGRGFRGEGRGGWRGRGGGGFSDNNQSGGRWDSNRGGNGNVTDSAWGNTGTTTQKEANVAGGWGNNGAGNPSNQQTDGLVNIPGNGQAAEKKATVVADDDHDEWGGAW